MSDDIWRRLKSKPTDSGQNKRPTQIKWKSTKSTPPNSTKKAVDSKADLFSIWDDQRRMDAEDKKMAQELAAAKKKAKELQKTLRKNKYGEITKSSSIKLKSLPKKARDFTGGHRKLTKISALIVALIIVSVFANSIFKNDKTETLGDSTSNLTVSEELPRETPTFTVLYPAGKSSKDYDTVRISPDGAEPSYTYLDSLTVEGQIFKVTQQEVPDGFDLDKVATEFQATSIIQIDEDKVYHGYSEQGGIQSLIFVKGGNLISIRSPQKFADDQWANYIISLQ